MANFNRRITGQQAVSAVMRSVGLLAPASVYDSLDKTVIQFWQLASEVGEKLLDEHEWQILGREFTITTSPGDNTYDLPEDWNGFINDAEWNRTSKLPAIGALTQPEWQEIQARSLGGTTIALLYQVTEDVVEFYSVPTSGSNTLIFPYNSRGWVRDSAGTTYRDNLMQNDDVILYDPQLFKVALKKAWFESKRFDTTLVMREYETALENAKAKDSPGRTLTLNRNGNTRGLLGSLNIPDTGLGS